MSSASLLRFALLALIGSSIGSPMIFAETAVPYRITGTVVNSVDGAPVLHCHLTATLLTRGRSGNRQFPAPLGTFDADEHGRFTIPLPSAGMWRVSASARGFITQAYEEHQAYSSAIVLTPGMRSMDLNFRLNPESSLAGVVVDEAGEPVRGAQVSVRLMPPPSPEQIGLPGGVRGSAMTDDRGMYELANLQPGSYQLSVQATPWYAVAAQPRRVSGSNVPALDPSLDVTYPLTWFPGVDDMALAETLVLHSGESRQADFHLIPIPSVHLRIVPPQDANAPIAGRSTPFFPLIQRVTPGGGQGFVPVTINNNGGQMDIGGLSPGLYQVRVAGQEQGRTALVEVKAGSVQTLNLSEQSATEARVTIHLDGVADSDGEAGGVQVTLIDSEGRGVFQMGDGNGGVRNLRRRQVSGGENKRVIEVPPGRYEVVLRNRSEIYLVGITAQSAEAVGRLVTLPAGESTLTLHVASGRAMLSGMASVAGKPSIAAMALLVPATFGQPGSMTIVRRDQTNTDGSFEMEDVIPGQYILIVIDQGWRVNWSDPSTLRHYLTQGVPLDLTSGANVSQKIEAQAP